MIGIESIEARLALISGAGQVLRFVGGAGALVGAMDQLKASPSAFVIPSSDSPSINTAGTSIVRQRVMFQWTVMLGFSNAGAAGASQLDAIETVRAAVMDQLIGWMPDGADAATEYAGGKIAALNLEQGIIFWGSEFRAPFYVRAP